MCQLRREQVANTLVYHSERTESAIKYELTDIEQRTDTKFKKILAVASNTYEESKLIRSIVDIGQNWRETVKVQTHGLGFMIRLILIIN